MPVNPYLQTLRRVPDDVILAVATRDIELGQGQSCLVGWVVREHLAAILQQPADDINAYGDGDDEDEDWTPWERAAKLFGGTLREWCNLYTDVEAWEDEARAATEIAFVDRVLEAVAA